MLKPIFGRKKVGGDAAATNSGNAQEQGSSGLPWRNLPEGGGCNMAVGELIHNLPRFLQDKDGRTHVETLLAAAGVIAGYAAQVSFWIQRAEGGLPADGPIAEATTKDGRIFLFGDAINNMLVPSSPEENRWKLWTIAAGNTVASGIPETLLPDLGRMFSAVAAQIGGEEEGFPRFDGSYRPRYPAGVLLIGLWPRVKSILRQNGTALGTGPGKLGPVPERLWYTVTAYAAGTLIAKTAKIVPPDICLAIVMQMAIYGSKLGWQAIDPELLPAPRGAPFPRD